MGHTGGYFYFQSGNIYVKCVVNTDLIFISFFGEVAVFVQDANRTYDDAILWETCTGRLETNIVDCHSLVSKKSDSLEALLVSVIIPVYNAERHLKECLDSCLEQTLEQIEIICVNDGSTDHTEEILNQYAKEYLNMIILHQENQGAGVARNLGIEHARGQYITFMDLDDYYPNKDALKKLYDAAVRKKVYACGGSALFVNDEKVNQNNTKLCFQENKIMHYKEHQSTGGFIQFLYSMQFLKESRIVFPAYRRYEDPPFFVEIMTKIERFYVISDWIYAIRKTDKLVSYNNPNIIVDILNGILDILKISRANQFEILHTNMVIGLMESYISYVHKLIYNKNEDVKKCYEKVLSEIDGMLLEQDCRKIRKPQLRTDEEINQMIHQSLKRELTLLKTINSYGEVLIYGAGMAGRTFYHYLLQKECRANIEFMVSVEKPNHTACGKKVKSIKECADKKDDVLVIITNKEDTKQMEESAHQYSFKNIEIVPYNELLLFGADMMQEETLLIY